MIFHSNKLFSSKIASELDAEEFVTIIKLLSTLRSMQTLIARQELVNMIINQCQLEQGWNVRMIDLCYHSNDLFVFFSLSSRVLILIDLAL
jgi:hypothetical protein